MMKRARLFCASLILCLLITGCHSGVVPAASYEASGNSECSTSPEASVIPETMAPTQISTEPFTESPTETPTEIPTEVPTEIPTEAPTEAPTEVTTDPPATEPEYIGSLYTREQLEAIDNTNHGYGPGDSMNGQRPETAVKLENKYGKQFDAHFIAPDDGRVYLTFSLGFEHNNLTASILDTLKEKGVKAVFFINMHYAEANYDLVRRMIDEGHIVGNHSRYHYTLAELDTDRGVREIMSLHEYVLETYGYEMTLFRPPSGYYSERVLAIAQSLGYQTVQWSFAYRDWEPEEQPEIDASRQKLIDSAHSGGIYALHTISSTNAAILGDVIDAIRAQGYEFALLDL